MNIFHPNTHIALRIYMLRQILYVLSCFSGWGLDAKSELPKTFYQEKRKDIFCNKQLILSAAFLSTIDSEKDRDEVETADKSDSVVEEILSSDNESVLPDLSNILLNDDERQNIKVGLFIGPPGFS